MNPDDTVTLTVSELLRLIHRKFCEGVAHAHLQGNSPVEPNAAQEWMHLQLEHLEGSLAVARSATFRPAPIREDHESRDIH